MLCNSLHHTGVVVANLEQMVRFYTEQLGMQVRLELDSIAPPTGNHTGIPRARRKLVFLGFPGEDHQVELVHYLDPPATNGYLDKHQLGAMHLCFNVDDLEASYQTLQAQGVRFVTEPKWSPTPEGLSIGVVYAQDPEGNWIELIQWPEG